MTTPEKRRRRGHWRSTVKQLKARGGGVAPLFVQESDATFALTLSAAVVARCGWLAGTRLLVREIPANADAGTKSAILVEAV